MCSALFSVFLTLFPIRFIIFVESLSSIISLWFSLTVSSSLEKHPFSSLSLFLSSHICLSEFSCISLSYFITAVLNSLSFKSQSSWLSLLSGDFLLSFCTAVLPWFCFFILLLILLQLSHFFLPFPPLHPTPPLPAAFLPLSTCPWVIHISYLSSPLAGVAQRIECWTQSVWFPVRAHAWVAGQVPSGGHTRDNHTLMVLSLSPSLPLFLKINK